MDKAFRNKRNFVKILLDIFSIFFSSLLITYIMFEEFRDQPVKIAFLYAFSYAVFDLLKNEVGTSWQYTDSRDVLEVIKLNLYSTISAFVLGKLLEFHSWRILALVFSFSTASMLLLRMIFRLQRQGNISPKERRKNRENTLVYGAGEAGNTLIRECRANKNFEYKIRAFIDDDPKKYRTIINGIRVYGGLDTIEEAIEEYDITTVIIAIPSLDNKIINDIFKKIEKIPNIKIKKLPFVSNLIDNSLTNQIKDVSIEDLLGRDQVEINDGSIKDLIHNKVVFVTGGAGSIGSELARQIAKYEPKKLVTIDVNENDIYFLELELKRKYQNLDLVSEICNIREKEKLEFLFNKYRPNIVFHAAAHKHVPLMEHNPEEAIKNNIFGTKNVAECANEFGVDRMVLISTDKAVNPTNLMGASKRACELVIEHMNEVSKGTKFMAVRFGNVLGSNGSVIPIFRKLIKEGKNLTLTHKDITRYFMTIPEAAQLVIEAGSIGNGGEIFILDMGKPIKIYDLAKNMIRLSNAKVGIDIVGLRPGEKLYEELLYDTNNAIKTANKKIFITKIDKGNIEIDKYFDELKECTHNPDISKIKEIMKKVVVSYKEVKYE